MQKKSIPKGLSMRFVINFSVQLLLVAFNHEQVQSMQLPVDQHQDISHPNSKVNPLSQAIQEGDIKLALRLIDQCNVIDDYHEKHGDIEKIFAQDLKDKGNFLEIICLDEEGRNPLHYAAIFLPEEEAWEIIYNLILKGEDPNATDNYLKTAAHYAMEHEKFKLVAALINTRQMRSFLTRDINDNTIMDLARKTNNRHMLSYLEKLFDERGVVDMPGIIPPDLELQNQTLYFLYTACYCGRPWRVKRYLEENPELINEAADDPQRAPLHYATIAHKNFVQDNVVIEIVTHLTSLGADINAQDAQKRTPMHYAAEQRRLAVFLLLKNIGANSDLCDINNETPFDIIRRLRVIEETSELHRLGELTDQ